MRISINKFERSGSIPPPPQRSKLKKVAQFSAQTGRLIFSYFQVLFFKLKLKEGIEK